ncbi:MAG: T9SS type A sorting domain-containing protein [candidate division Zixibacteria bacterium]|nr:T9SS type A sorting domain-containing protein [candidate division Zixibacteria bacterium]
MKSLRVIINVSYDGPPRILSLLALDLPAFSSGWSGNQVTCGNCTLSDTITFNPSICDAGVYDIAFIGTADYERGLSDTLHYFLHVLDNDGPCQVEAGPDRRVAIGNELAFNVNAIDPDTICAPGKILKWEYWGYPFNHGAAFEVGLWQGRFAWTPTRADLGVHYAYFRITHGMCVSLDSVKITVDTTGTDCSRPIIIPEPRFTAGTSNTIYYIPACGAYTHEVCYFDYDAPDSIRGCMELPWQRTLSSSDTLSWVVDNLLDGHRYVYYIKAYFASDSIVRSDTTSSTQDASPPDDVNSTVVRADSAGVINIDWYGVQDKVSYVAYYKLYRKQDGQDYDSILTFPAKPDNSIATEYHHEERLGDNNGLIEGLPYFYKVIAIDVVGNRGGGIEAGPVVPDSTPPCIPEQRVDFDSRFINKYFVKGVECQVWARARADCPGLMSTTHFIRFQAVRDSVKYFDSQWQPGTDFFESSWLPYPGDSVSWEINLLPRNDDTAYVHGHNYLYRAQAKDSLGNISYWINNGVVQYWSSPIGAWQDAYPPSDIRNLTARPRINRAGDSVFIDLSWEPAIDPVSGVKSYYVYRKIGGGEYVMIATIPTSISNPTFYSDNCRGVASREQICYRIGSVDFVGNERDLNHTAWEICARPPIGPTIALECDTIISGRCYVGNHPVVVSWKGYDNTGVSKYLVDVAGNAYYQDNPALEYLGVPLTKDTTYVVRVRAIFPDGSVSTWSNPCSVIRDVTPPDPVTRLIARNDVDCDGRIQLDWAKAYDKTGVSHYIVARRTAGTVFDSIGISFDTSWADMDGGLTVYQMYTYTVWPVDALNNVQKFGNDIDSTTCLRPPKIVGHSGDAAEIKINWNRAMPNLAADASYFVRVLKNDDSKPVRQDTVYRTQSYPFYPDQYGPGIYTFQVKELVSVRGDSMSSLWSCGYPVPFATLPPPVDTIICQPQPLLPSDTGQAKGWIQLNWEQNNLRYIDSFLIVRSVGSPVAEVDSNWVRADGGTDYSYPDSGLQEYIVYTYDIYACDQFKQFSTKKYALSAIDPIWVYTPKIKAEVLPYFKDDTVTTCWLWLDRDLQEATGNYGAVSCQVQLSIFPYFDTVYSRNSDWVDAGRECVSINVGEIVGPSNRIVYRRIRANDQWGNISPWSPVYFGLDSIIYDNVAPIPVKTLAIKTVADSSAAPGLIDVHLRWRKSTDFGSGVSHYLVYRCGIGGICDSLGYTTDTVYSDLNLNILDKSSCDYEYRIVPVDSIGNKQIFGNIDACLELIPVPDSLQALSKRDLTWKCSASADSFFVECAYVERDLGTFRMKYYPREARKMIPGTSDSCHFDTDTNFVRNEVIYFHIKTISGGNESGWSRVCTFPMGNESQIADPAAGLARWELEQNFPNPFNPVTRIAFRLPMAGEVTLSIYNIRGQLVKRLCHEEFSAGVHQLEWNGTDENNKDAASGIYFYRIQAADFVSTRKMLLLR